MSRKHQGEILEDARQARERRTMGTELAERLDEVGLELPELTTIERPGVPTVQSVIAEPDGLTDAERLVVEAVSVEKPRAVTPAEKAAARVLKACKRGHPLSNWRITPKHVPYCTVCYTLLRIEQAAKKTASARAATVDSSEETAVDASEELAVGAGGSDN